MSVSMTMNGAVLPVMAMYIVAAEEQVRYYVHYVYGIIFDEGHSTNKTISLQ